MTPDELQTIGAALYGPQYRRPLCSALNVPERTFYWWLNNEIPEGLEARLEPIVAERIEALTEVRRNLARRVKAAAKNHKA